MPLVRYEVRCEHSLANPELYRTAGQDDSEGLLEGVAMAGLVGIVRQLGDLAEFAAEIFHDLHDDIMATVSRGRNLRARVDRLEVDLPAVEKALLAESRQFKFAYTELGMRRIEMAGTFADGPKPLCARELPRFVQNFYDDCRGPPRLFLLDKFDEAGRGACVKRYTDPTFFRLSWAASLLTKAEQKRREREAELLKKSTEAADNAGQKIYARERLSSALFENLEGFTGDFTPELRSRRLDCMFEIPTEGVLTPDGLRSPEEPRSPGRRRLPQVAEGPVLAPLKISVKDIENAKLGRRVYKPNDETLSDDESSDAEFYVDALTTMGSDPDSEPGSRTRWEVDSIQSRFVVESEIESLNHSVLKAHVEAHRHTPPRKSDEMECDEDFAQRLGLEELGTGFDAVREWEDAGGQPDDASVSVEGTIEHASVASVDEDSQNCLAIVAHSVPQESLPSILPDKLPDKPPDYLSDTLADKFPYTLPDKPPDNASDKLPDTLSDKLPDTLSDILPDTLSDKLPDTLSDILPDTLSDKLPDNLADKPLDTLSDKLPDTLSDKLPDNLADKPLDTLSDKPLDNLSDKLPDTLSDKLPDNLADKLPDTLFDKLPDNVSDKLPDTLADKLPDTLSDKLPDALSDKLPDTLPDKLPISLPDKLPDTFSDKLPYKRPDKKLLSVPPINPPARRSDKGSDQTSDKMPKKPPDAKLPSVSPKKVPDGRSDMHSDMHFDKTPNKPTAKLPEKPTYQSHESVSLLDSFRPSVRVKPLVASIEARAQSVAVENYNNKPPPQVAGKDESVKKLCSPVTTPRSRRLWAKDNATQIHTSILQLADKDQTEGANGGSELTNILRARMLESEGNSPEETTSSPANFQEIISGYDLKLYHSPSNVSTPKTTVSSVEEDDGYTSSASSSPKGLPNFCALLSPSESPPRVADGLMGPPSLFLTNSHFDRRSPRAPPITPFLSDSPSVSRSPSLDIKPSVAAASHSPPGPVMLRSSLPPRVIERPVASASEKLKNVPATSPRIASENGVLQLEPSRNQFSTLPNPVPRPRTWIDRSESNVAATLRAIRQAAAIASDDDTGSECRSDC